MTVELESHCLEIAEKTLELERLLYRESFADFARAAWPVISKRRLVWGWHLDLICDTLERVARGELSRVIFNVPPRSLKSMLVSVLFPAWKWARDPSHQFLTVSHTRKLSTRDARHSRNLIQSDWYRRLFPNVVIVSDQNQKMYYETSDGGHRNAGSFKEGLTGSGGDTILVDDPISAEKVAVSDNELNRVIEVFEESIEQRLNDPGKSAIIIIMQRLHENDLTGWIIKNRKREGWVHICLPLLFETDHPNKCPNDKRTHDGEVLLEGRWPRPAIDAIRAKPIVFAGQYQQRPTVRGGLILLRKSFSVWTEANMPEIRYVIMSLDAAFKPGQENDYSACTVWGMFDRLTPETALTSKKTKMDAILMHAWRGRLRYPELRQRLQIEYSKWVKRQMRPNVVLIEDKASGISLIQELDAAGIPGVIPWPPKRHNTIHANEPKVFRAQLASEILDDGAIWVPGKLMTDGKRDTVVLVPWAEDVVAECESFPRGEHDDYVDTAVQAWRFMRESDLVDSSADVDEPTHDMIDSHTHDPREPFYG